ncbi:MAG: histidine phosphatase family protein [Acidobacteriota bacterium]
MTLYLLRHGNSERKSLSGRDQDRGLTVEGLTELLKTLQEAKAEGAAPNWILSSPYRRAGQTAEMAARVLECANQIVESGSLTPESEPAELWAEVREWADQGPVLVVAHEPLLSATASWMLGATRVMIEFTPGMLVQIDFAVAGAEPLGVLKRIWT